MNHSQILKQFATFAGVAAMATLAGAQSIPPITQLRTDGIKPEANVIIPDTSKEGLGNIGRTAHTHFLLYTGSDMYTREPEALMMGDMDHGPQRRRAGNPSGFNPTQIRQAYGVTGAGKGVIAIVDAYHYPTSLKDFNTFATQFSLPLETSTNATASTNKVFQVAYAAGAQPATNAGWAQEEALDIEWAHAMAPSAKIVLVEAASASYNDLFNAVTYASKITGVTQISMSWGGSEFSGETTFDTALSAIKTVSLFASSGDTGGLKSYPALSPAIIAVGGTSLFLDSKNNWSNETAWSGSGGGVSAYEALPTYQKSITSVSLGKRGGPDISAVANPSTGVAVYDSTASGGMSGWLVFGGTSVSSPVCAGIANAIGAARGNAELAWIYAHTASFHDIISGTAGSNACKTGWDLVTGWGSPKTNTAL
jgi:subtilase family serine protease